MESMLIPFLLNFVSQDSLNLIAHFHEFLGAAQMLRPRHFRNMDKSFHSGGYFDKCAVISHDNHLALDLISNLKAFAERIPRMRGKLLETESDPLLVIIKVEDDNIEFLVELYDLLGMVDPAP